ncbi:hypothetical protein Avbf_19072, partial [Armadillidium vulgare]
ELKTQRLILTLLFLTFKITQLVLQTFASVKSYFNIIEDGVLFSVFFLNISLLLKNLIFFLCHCKEKFRSKTKEKILLISFICIYLLVVAFYVYHYLVKPLHTPNKYNKTHSYQEENGTTVTNAASTESISPYSSINNEEALAKKIKVGGLFEMNSSTNEIIGIICTVAIIKFQIILYIIIRYLRKIHTLIDQELAVETRTDTQSLISDEEALSLSPEEIVNEEASSLSPEEIVNEERNTHDECEEEKKKESETESFEILIPQEDD